MAVRSRIWRWWTLICLGVVFTSAWQEVSTQDAGQPLESQCRPYIEKALKEQHGHEAAAPEADSGQVESIEDATEENVSVEQSPPAESEEKSGEQQDSKEDGVSGEQATEEEKSDEAKDESTEGVSADDTESTEAETIEESGGEESTENDAASETADSAEEHKVDEIEESGEGGADDDDDDEENKTGEEQSEENKEDSKEGDDDKASAEDDKVSAEGDEDSQEGDTQEDEGQSGEEQGSVEESANVDQESGEQGEESKEDQTTEDQGSEEGQEESGEPQESAAQEQSGEDSGEQEVKSRERREVGDEESGEQQQESAEPGESGETGEESGEQPQDSGENGEDSGEKTEESGENPEESGEPQESAEEASVEETKEESTENPDSKEDDDDQGESKEEVAEESKEESVEEQADQSEGDKEAESVENDGKSDEEEEKTSGSAADSKEDDDDDGDDDVTQEDSKEAGGESVEEKQESGEQAESGESEADKQEESKEEGSVGDDKEDSDETADTGEEESKEEEVEDDSKEGEETLKTETPEEELTLDIIIPDNLRTRGHIADILHLDTSSVESDLILGKIIDSTLKELKRLYDTAIKPLEVLYKYRDLSNRHFGDPEIFSKPLILFMGPWSGGKSSIINYLLGNEFKPTALRTGAEPSPAYFNILMWGDKEEVLDGTQLAADWTFSGLQKFGQGLLDRLSGRRQPNRLLEKVNIVEIPGILEIRKQVERLFPFNDACQWFIDRADIIFLVYDPAKLDVGMETEAILDQLKGREYQTRIILNKADQVKPEELMRVQGTLIWNISPLMSSTEPPVMYSTSLWSMPYEVGAPIRLLQAQERAFLNDLKGAIDKRVENKISSARRFAVRVRNHAKMVDCYLTTFYNHKTFFGNKKKISDDIIEHPQDYHIYEGLSTLTNISRYDLPDPDVYKDFFKLNNLYEFQQLAATCTYFRGCPINRLDVAIAYDLPELVGKYRKQAEQALTSSTTPPKS